MLWISDSETISGVSDGLVNAVVGQFLGIPIGFYYGLLLCLVLWYVFEYSRARTAAAVRRARAQGVAPERLRVPRLRWGALIVTGVLSAAAGVLYAGTTGGADSTSGARFLLPAYAAAFLGATTIMPGASTRWDARRRLLPGDRDHRAHDPRRGVVVQDLFYGGALVLAVALSHFPRRKELREAEAS